MKRLLFGLAVAASAAVIAQLASATTFPTLTTIYIGTGVYDDGSGANAGAATIFTCTNVSGVQVSVRFLVLSHAGVPFGSFTETLNHGATKTAATHETAFFVEDVALAPGITNSRGAINIESTESAVFCSATITDAAGTPDFSFDLRLVRVNPHPGTVE